MRDSEAESPKAPLSVAGRYEVGTLLVLLLAMASLWIFAKIAGGVAEGSTRAFDERVLLAMRAPENPSEPLGPRWVDELSRDITSLGSGSVLILLTVSSAVFLALQGKHRIMALLLVAVFGGMILGLILKSMYERPRPELISREALPVSMSFPSGHSMASAITYLTLGALLARVQPKRRLKVFLLFLSFFITILVGLTRIYLGVHWPTDVLAGWTAGAGWALLCWTVALWLQKRGRVDRVRAEAPVQNRQ
jgi:undecaprenyl-diphosphatase